MLHKPRNVVHVTALPYVVSLVPTLGWRRRATTVSHSVPSRCCLISSGKGRRTIDRRVDRLIAALLDGGKVSGKRAAEPGFEIVRSLPNGHVAAVQAMIRKLGSSERCRAALASTSA
jgi:hypothetical protein